MRIFVYLIFLCLPLSGCVILGNLDEIFTLQDYSHDKEAQHRLVQTINDHYDALTRIIADGHIHDYKNESAFERAFGQPILKRDLSNGQERWLYRYAIYRFAKDKVYVYFDHAGQMISWEKLPCSKFL